MKNYSKQQCRLLRITLLLGFILSIYGVSPASAANDPLISQVSVALSLPANPIRGKALFNRNCIACHALHAYGDPFKAVPSLAGQHFSYLVRQIAYFSDGERKNSGVHWALDRNTIQSPQSWADVAAYLSNLPMMRFAQTGGSRNIDIGRTIFNQQCASCHHADASGNADGTVPALRDQHFSYLSYRLHALAQDKRHEVDPGLMRIIQTLNNREIGSLANYLSHLKGPSRRVAQNSST